MIGVSSLKALVLWCILVTSLYPVQFLTDGIAHPKIKTKKLSLRGSYGAGPVYHISSQAQNNNLTLKKSTHYFFELKLKSDLRPLLFVPLQFRH
jgi:hypothetical protein